MTNSIHRLYQGELGQTMTHLTSDNYQDGLGQTMTHLTSDNYQGEL